MKKILAVFLVVVMLFVGCKGEDKKTKLIYGKEVKQFYLTNDMTITLDPKLAIGDRATRTAIIADKNYVSDEEVLVIAKYFYAIQNNDLEVFKEIMYPLFEAYIQADTAISDITIGDWLQQIYTYTFEMAGGEFNFFEVEVLQYDDNELNGKVGYLLEDLYKITDFEIAYNNLNGINERKLTDKNVHTFTTQARLTTTDGDYKYIDANLYMFKVDEEYKLMSIS